MREKYEDDFQAGMGAEAIKKLLAEIDCEELSDELREELKTASGQKKREASSSAWRSWRRSASPATSPSG